MHAVSEVGITEFTADIAPFLDLDGEWKRAVGAALKTAAEAAYKDGKLDDKLQRFCEDLLKEERIFHGVTPLDANHHGSFRDGKGATDLALRLYYYFHIRMPDLAKEIDKKVLRKPYCKTLVEPEEDPGLENRPPPPPVPRSPSESAATSGDAAVQSVEVESPAPTWQPYLYLPPRRDDPASTKPESRYKFNVHATKVIGRSEQETDLRAFADLAPGFRWMQIAGVAGQGKSRLAYELALERKDMDWNAGFLLVRHLKVFTEKVAEDWNPDQPHLIVIDYVLGRELEIGGLLDALALRGDLKQSVRVLLLERQRWDRGGADQKSVDSDGNATFSLGSTRAAWFTTLQSAAGHLELTDFAEPVVELKPLSRDDLVKLVRLYAQTDITLSDKTIGDRLEKIDKSGRPLFALFLSDALSDSKAAGQTNWTREELLDFVLRRNGEKRWRPVFGTEPPRLGTDTPAMRIALLATLARGIGVETARDHLGRAYTDQTEHEALVLLDVPTGRSSSGPTELFLPLEPDLLGGWFVLRCVSKGMDIAPLLEVAWRTHPVETGATLRRIGEDFPDNQHALGLFDIEPEHAHAQIPYLTAITAALGAVWQHDSAFTERQIVLLERASHADDGEASGLLGLVYNYGNGVDPDPKEGARYFELGYEQNSAAARDNWALCLIDGTANETDHLTAEDLLEIGVENGRNRSRRLLAQMLLEGWTRERNDERAIALILEAVEDGDGLAMAYLGLCYQQGIGVEEADPVRAVELYEEGRAAKNGLAMAYLGFCYQQGIGVEEADAVRAVELYEEGRAAKSGLAMAYLGLCYEHGIGVEKADRETTLRCYQDAIDSRYAGARLYWIALSLIADVPAPRLDEETIAISIVVGPPEPWADTPPIAGAWRQCDDKERILTLLARTAEWERRPGVFDGRAITAARSMPLVCYSGLELIDLQFKDEKGTTTLASALLSGTGAMLLDGNLERLRRINVHALKLDSTEAQVQYLRLACEFMRGRGGPFHILGDDKDIPFLDASSGQTALEGIDIVPPLETGKDTDGGVLVEAYILYADALSKAKMLVMPNGEVGMPESEILVEELPVRRRAYDGIFRSPLLDPERTVSGEH